MGASNDETESDGEDEWRFSVDDFPDPNETADPDSAGETSQREQENDRLSRARQPLEPGSINPENAFFVLVGVAIVAGLIVGALLGF